jgi:hypothetical protein
MKIIGECDIDVKLDDSYENPVIYRQVKCLNKDGHEYIQVEKISHLIDEFGNRITTREWQT